MSEPRKWSCWSRPRNSAEPWRELVGLHGTVAQAWDAVHSHTFLTAGEGNGEDCDYLILPAGERPPAGRTYRHRMMTPASP